MEHTPEPWNYHEHGDRDLTDFLIYRGDWSGIMEHVATTSDWTAHDEANARRIVACVNKLAGWSIKDLENTKIKVARVLPPVERPPLVIDE